VSEGPWRRLSGLGLGVGREQACVACVWQGRVWCVCGRGVCGVCVAGVCGEGIQWRRRQTFRAYTWEG
jgi:hypothetical protein